MKTTPLYSSERDERKIIVIGGAFSTGKSTLIEGIKKEFGEKYRYIPDAAREVIASHMKEGETIENCSREKVGDIQREIMDRYIDQESRHDGRVTIADGSLVEVLAYSEGVLSPSDKILIGCLLNYRGIMGMYTYIKMPIGVTPVTYDGLRHTDLAHQAMINNHLDFILDRFEINTIRLNTTSDFTPRYQQVRDTLRHLHTTAA